MAIALCLSGKIGNTKGKSGYHKSEYKVLKKGYDHYKKHVIDVNDNVDVFVHCWDIELKDEIHSLYKPKDGIVEEQVVFDIPEYVQGDKQRIQNHYSRWFSNMQVNKLCSNFSRKTNTHYDFVMTTRFDLAFETDIVFNKYDKNKFYAGNWSSVNYNGHDIFKGGRGPLYDIVNTHGKGCLESFNFSHKGYPHTNEGLLDLWFFSNFTNSKNFNKMFLHLDEYNKPNNCPTDSNNSISNHQLSLYHLEKLSLLDQLEFILDMYDDFPEVRRKYYGCKK